VVPPPSAAITSPAKGAASPRTFAVRQFDKVALVITEGTRTREQPVLLRLDETSIVVQDRDSPRVLRHIPYESVQAAEFRQSEHRPFMVKTVRYWLMLRAGGTEIELRLDKGNYDAIVADLEERTLKVKRIDDAPAEKIKK
jgi:hypothetical protein